MSLKLEDVEKVIRWKGGWKVVFIKSKQDHMKVRNGSPTPEFWDLWREKKAEIKALGISVRKEEDEEEETYEWVISHWDDATEDEKLRAKQEWAEKMAKRREKQDRFDGTLE
jgi:hypothetical protein